MWSGKRSSKCRIAKRSRDVDGTIWGFTSMTLAVAFVDVLVRFYSRTIPPLLFFSTGASRQGYNYPGFSSELCKRRLWYCAGCTRYFLDRSFVELAKQYPHLSTLCVGYFFGCNEARGTSIKLKVQRDLGRFYFLTLVGKFSQMVFVRCFCGVFS